MIDLTTTQARLALGRKYAAKYLLDSALVCALVERESSWNPWATRYEPAFYRTYIQKFIDSAKIVNMTEATMRATSFGLGQVMGQVARELGFTGRYLTELCDPEIGLDYACRKLQQCVDAHMDNVPGALSQYNGGGDPTYAPAVIALMTKYF